MAIRIIKARFGLVFGCLSMWATSGDVCGSGDYEIYSCGPCFKITKLPYNLYIFLLAYWLLSMRATSGDACGSGALTHYRHPPLPVVCRYYNKHMQQKEKCKKYCIKPKHDRIQTLFQIVS